MFNYVCIFDNINFLPCFIFFIKSCTTCIMFTIPLIWLIFVCHGRWCLLRILVSRTLLHRHMCCQQLSTLSYVWYLSIVHLSLNSVQHYIFKWMRHILSELMIFSYQTYRTSIHQYNNYPTVKACTCKTSRSV
jgi:hypothetical protein